MVLRYHPSLSVKETNVLMGPSDFSYSGDPETSPLDAVRFLCNDVDEDDAILTDTEIKWLIGQFGGSNIYKTAAEACDLAAMKYARVINRQTGTLELNLGAENPYQIRAAQLRSQASEIVGPVLAAGGVRPPMFWLGQFDNEPVRSNRYPSSPPYGNQSGTDDDRWASPS